VRASESAVAPSRSESQSTYWDARMNGMVKVIQPGEFSATDDRSLSLMTLLGSCVSACICDPKTGIGGLNHFLLPDGNEARDPLSVSAPRYGVQAMELLINGILRLGGNKARLEAKIFGGANVISLSARQSVGDKNQAFALAFLNAENIPVTARGLGGTCARRVFFQPWRNKVFVQTPRPGEGEKLQRAEEKLRKARQNPEDTGEVDLF